jgi:hypothetical protein
MQRQNKQVEKSQRRIESTRLAQNPALASICLRVLATSRGQVAPAEITPAMKPAEKFAPNITAALL